MKVFITGGTGLIGNIVVKKLIERGDEVTVLSRDKENVKKRFHNKVELIQANLYRERSVAGYRQ